MQSIQRIAPLIPKYQIIPFRDEIVDRTALFRLAKRNAAIHAAGALSVEALDVVVRIDFVEIQ